MTTVSIPTATQTWRVLVIDDSPEGRAEIRRLLLLGSARQYQFVEANTGLAGVAGVRAVLNTNKLPDCVVLDFNLPDMDAVEVLAALVGPDGLTPCPVVVVTVAVGIEQTRAVLRAGAQDFLSKGSMTPESLTRAVESATERWAMAREQREQKAIVNTSEERLRLAIAGSDLGTWHWDILNGTLDWSERCLEIFGIPPRTAMSYEKFLTAIHPEDRARANDAVQHALQHGSEYRIEFRSVWPDGSVHWALSTGRAYHDLAGVPTRMEGIALNITQLKRSEEARHELARNYRALAEASFEMPYRMSADWSTMLPLDGRELLASSDRPLTDWGWMAQYLPSDEQARVRQSISDAIAAKKLFEMEHRVLRLDGSTGWVHSRSVPILDENQVVVEWFGVVSDITELKRAEKALLDKDRNYRALATASSEIAYRMSADWSTMLPLDGRQLVPSSDQPVADWTWMDRNLPPDEHARVRQAISEAIARKSLFELEHRVRRPDGSVGWTLSRAVPILDENEAVTAWFGAASDISARKQAEEAQRLLASIVENSRDFIGISDTSGNPLYGNRAAMELVGVKDLEHLRRSRFIDYFIPEHRQLVEEVVLPAVATDGRWTGELTMQHFVTGAKIPVWYDLFRVDDPVTGRPVNFATITRDLTKLKLADEALREKTHFLQRIAEVTPGVLHVYDLAEKRVVFINRSVTCLLGYSPQEVLAMGANATSSLMHPEDLPRFDEYMARVCALADGEVTQFEFRMRDRDHAWHWFLSHGSVFSRDAAGVARQTIGVASEITERKQAQQTLADRTELLNGVLEGTTDVVFVNDLNGRCLMANSACAAMLGSTPDQVVGKTTEEWSPPGLATAMRKHDKAVVAGGSPIQCEETFIVAGQPRVFLTLKAPLRDGGGRVTGVLGISRDITERKWAEQERRLLASIVEFSPDFIGISDTQGNPVYGNRAAMELVGIQDLEQVRRSKIIEYFIPEQRQFVAEVVLPAVVKDGRWYGELAMQHFVTGAAIPVWYDLFRVDDPLTGRPINFATITRDLTESKRIEATLRESQERFNNIANAAPAMLWMTKPDATLEFVSRGWNAYTGQTEAESFGIDGFGWLQVIHPDDRERSEKVFLDASSTSEPFSLDYRIRRADGEYRWAIDSGRPHTDAKGQFLGYVGSVIDVHDRKQVEATLRKSEEMLRLALRDTGIIVYTTDADLRYNWIHNPTPAFRPEDLVGRRDEDLLPAEQAAILTAIKQRVLDTGMGETGEVAIEVGGRHYVYNLVVEPSRDPDGRIVGLTAAAMDITVTKQAEEKLRLLAAELTETDRRKDVFLATLAHELRNPLAPIRAGLHLIKLAGNNPEMVKNSLEIIERQVGQLNHLINDLMDVSRISRGKIVLKKARLLAADVVQDAIDTSRPLIEERGHHLVVEMPPEPLYVNADRTRLVQVFSNLLNNAAKYTDTGGRIKLTVERHNGELTVAVEDNGVGIPAHMLTRVFDMFSQIDGSLEKSQGGLGIGLNIVKRLAELHDGSIVAESAGHGAGSRFLVRLPLALSLHAEQRDEETKSVTAPARRRILVVDDNKDAAISLALVLKIMGHQLQTAHDGLEALEVAAVFCPDLVLLDLGMPKLNGYDTARRIREQPWGKATVLVALSGWGQDEDKRKSHEAGFDAHMVKPIDPAMLDKILDGLKTSVA